MDAQKGSGLCPGCKEPYKMEDYEEDPQDFSSGTTLQLPAPDGSKRDPKNMSMMKRNQTGEFDHNRWLFETKGTYGVGNAFWPQDDVFDDEDDEEFKGGMMDPKDKPWKPLSRKIPIPAAVISPYRLNMHACLIKLHYFSFFNYLL
jgi:hypothetical protein